MNDITDQKHIMLRVKKTVTENSIHTTLFFDYSLRFKPGQFIMLWIPGIDEKPFTISYHTQKTFGVTIESKGIFSKKAADLKKGDLVGFRGCFGNGFSVKGYHSVAVIAGGCGLAPLSPLIESLETEDITFIHGARTKEILLYKDRFNIEREICTDDGSVGTKGFVTDLLLSQIKSGKTFDMVYTCGPEIMMKRIFEICEAHNIPCQVSLERYMRCGFGVCGACVCGKEIVCKDGPVFGTGRLRTMTDFNQSALLKSGQPVDLPDYFLWRNTQITT